MKSDKLCISKSVAILVPVVLVFLAVVLLSNFISEQKLSTKSRASEQVKPQVKPYVMNGSADGCAFLLSSLLPNNLTTIRGQQFTVDPKTKCVQVVNTEGKLVNYGYKCIQEKDKWGNNRKWYVEDSTYMPEWFAGLRGEDLKSCPVPWKAEGRTTCLFKEKIGGANIEKIFDMDVKNKVTNTENIYFMDLEIRKGKITYWLNKENGCINAYHGYNKYAEWISTGLKCTEATGWLTRENKGECGIEPQNFDEPYSWQKAATLLTCMSSINVLRPNESVMLLFNENKFLLGEDGCIKQGGVNAGDVMLKNNGLKCAEDTGWIGEYDEVQCPVPQGGLRWVDR